MINSTQRTSAPDEKDYIVCMREFYREHIENYPDVVQTSDIISITGFSKSAITNWVRSGRIKAMLYKKKFLFQKDCLLEFLTSSYYLSIIRKTDLQRQLMASFDALYRDNHEVKGGE